MIQNNSGQNYGWLLSFEKSSLKNSEKEKLNKYIYGDYLTGLYNRRYMEEKLIELDNEKNFPLGIVFADVNALKITNDVFGHEKGDELLHKTALLIKEVGFPKNINCRSGGDEFAIIVPKTTENEMKQFVKSLVARGNMEKIGLIKISLAVGYAIKKNNEKSIKDIKIQADSLMYKNKIKIGKEWRINFINRVIEYPHNNYDYEKKHAEGVKKYCKLMAKALNFFEKDVKEVSEAGFLHDIGKIKIAKEVFMQKMLTKKDLEEIETHPEVGNQILKGVTKYASLAEYVLYHHERWDGKGYPYGLSKEEIPLPARIIAIADAFEAMTSKRVYKEKKSFPEAILELKKEAGKQFDPNLVKIFINCLKK